MSMCDAGHEKSGQVLLVSRLGSSFSLLFSLTFTHSLTHPHNLSVAFEVALTA